MKTISLLFLVLVSYTVKAQDINQMDINGERHGMWRKNFDKTNQPRYEGQFAHGKEIGLFKFYKLVNGKSVLSATKEFNADNEIAIVKFFSSTGKLISEGKMDGKLFIDKWTYYHKKVPTVMSIEHYNDKGQLHGEKIVFYELGQIAETSNFINGKQEGKATWYSEKGVLIKEFMYENDELHGLSKYYDNKGQLIAEGAYKRGQKHGIWKYYTNGKLTEEKDFTVTSKNPKKQ
ncbi:toxin-antitoxin system YwqK family antitoxin [Geojedonia litorea]|uniref:Toxin-antitoxin system YwqK family antitoxin n=1 Tax=Geojedonia litorea TaxID=1268269 RepID=A0ABV9N007_9FLAO